MDADEIAIKRREFKLDIWKVIISALTPIAIGALTFVVNGALQERGELLKREEQILSEKQKVYGELGKRLNIIYVYVADVGDFKSYTPERVVEMKRESDRQFFVYRPYWSEATEQRYNDYMKAAFTTYNGVGLPARINASKIEKMAAYEQDGLKWDTKWDPYFTEQVDTSIERKYYSLVSSVLADTVNATVRKLP
jgi:hypothetical protein